MSVFKFGFVLLLSMFSRRRPVSCSGNNRIQSRFLHQYSLLILKTFWLKVLSTICLSNVANRGPKKANSCRWRLLAGRTGHRKRLSKHRCANCRCANDGRQKASPASDPSASKAICVAGSRAAAGACCQACSATGGKHEGPLPVNGQVACDRDSRRGTNAGCPTAKSSRLP